MLNTNNTVLVVIDVQGKLAQLMYQKEELFTNLAKIIQGVQVLEIPIIWTEQVPEKLGPTLPELIDLLTPIAAPMAKSSFSCYGHPPFVAALNSLDRKQVLLTGIETHVCVYQTALDLLEAGYEVQIVTDAVSSRTQANKLVGLERMKEAGASLTSTEMALFELLQVAEGPQFKQIARIVK
ncbi:MAG: hydrolase [Anaerolineae bacterium]|nr:hydrolase [Anaerolineae bacterium]